MTGEDIRDGGYVLEFLLKHCVQSVCIESVFYREHYTEASTKKEFSCSETSFKRGEQAETHRRHLYLIKSL